MKKPVSPKESTTVQSEGYPSWENSEHRPGGCDSSRRRFLRQIGAGGAGVACLAALPSLANGKSVPVEFWKLDRHPKLHDTPHKGAAHTQTDSIIENRALWIEPGYLLMIKWTRSTEDSSPIEAFEASASELQSFLATRVTTVDHLHNIDQLHVLESELLTFLQSRLSTTTIDVLHLDHACPTVCSLLDPSYYYPDDIQVDGGMGEIDWEH